MDFNEKELHREIIFAIKNTHGIRLDYFIEFLLQFNTSYKIGAVCLHLM